MVGLLALLLAACGGGGSEEAAQDEGTEAAADTGGETAAGGDAASVEDNPEEGVTSDQIVLGWMGDATGPTASAQAFNLAGSQAAVEYFNEQGGVLGRELVLVDEDDAFSAETAVTNYDSLVNDEQVLAILQMGGSHISEALMPQVETDQIPVIGPPQTIDAQLENPYVFNNIGHYSDEADVAVEYMVNEVGSAEDLRVAVIQLELPSGDEWNTYIENRLGARGGTYVDRLLLNASSPDYAGTVQRLRQLVDGQDVNFVAFHGAPATGLGVITEMSRLGFEVPIVGIHGIAGTTIYEEGPEDQLDNVHGVHSFLPGTSECEMCTTIQEFTAGTEYEEQIGEINFGHGWLDVYIAIQAIERAAESGELSRASLYEALQGEFETGGLSCPIDWSSGNHSPCAAPFEWDGERLDTVAPFDEWAPALEGEYGLTGVR